MCGLELPLIIIICSIPGSIIISFWTSWWCCLFGHDEEYLVRSLAREMISHSRFHCLPIYF